MDSMDSAGKQAAPLTPPLAPPLAPPSPEEAFETLCQVLQRSGLELKSAQLAVGFFALPHLEAPKKSSRPPQIREQYAAWNSGELLPAVRIVHDRGMVSEVPLYLDWHLRDRTGQGLSDISAAQLLTVTEQAGLRGMNHGASETQCGATFIFGESSPDPQEPGLHFLPPGQPPSQHPQLRQSLREQPLLVQRWRGHQRKRLLSAGPRVEFIAAEEQHSKTWLLSKSLRASVHLGRGLALSLFIASMPTLGEGDSYTRFFLSTAAACTAIGCLSFAAAYDNELKHFRWISKEAWIFTGFAAVLITLFALISGIFQVVTLNTPSAVASWQLITTVLFTPVGRTFNRLDLDGMQSYLSIMLTSLIMIPVTASFTGGLLSATAAWIAVTLILAAIQAQMLRRTSGTLRGAQHQADLKLVHSLLEQPLLPTTKRRQLSLLKTQLVDLIASNTSDTDRQDRQWREDLLDRSCAAVNRANRQSSTEDEWEVRMFEQDLIRWRHRPRVKVWNSLHPQRAPARPALAHSPRAATARATADPSARPEITAELSAPQSRGAAQLRRMALISELVPTTTLDVIPEPAPLTRPQKA